MPILAKLPEEPKRRLPRLRRLKSVAILPTLMTLANLLCGFAAIYFCLRAMHGAGAGIDPTDTPKLKFHLMERLMPSYVCIGAFLIFLGMVFDGLDGRLARLSKSTSQFGAQLDSLADIVSFGAAPALLMLTLLIRQLEGEWVVTPLSDDLFGRTAWVTAAVFAGCAAMRLARFNVEHSKAPPVHKYFHGLPTPGAAATIVSLIILHEHIYLKEPAWGLQGSPASQLIVKALPLVALACGLLMVSRIRYVHVGNVYLGGRRSFPYVLRVLLVLALALWYPALTLAVLVCAYTASGPAGYLYRRVRPKPTEETAETSPDTEESTSSPGQHTA